MEIYNLRLTLLLLYSWCQPLSSSILGVDTYKNAPRMEGKVHGGVSAAALPFSGITLVSRGLFPGVIPSVMEPGGLSLHP